MINLNKKVVLLCGYIVFPLRVGESAIIFYSGGMLRTSAVEVIKQVTHESIVFETQNSIYCVSTHPDPVPAATAGTSGIQL